MEYGQPMRTPEVGRLMHWPRLAHLLRSFPGLPSSPVLIMIMVLAQRDCVRGGIHDEHGLDCSRAASANRRAVTGRLLAASTETDAARLPREACSEEGHAPAAVRRPACRLGIATQLRSGCKPCHVSLPSEPGYLSAGRWASFS